RGAAGPTPACRAFRQAPQFLAWRRSSSILRGLGRSRNRNLAAWLRMGAQNDPIREQRWAEARPPIKVPLPYHLDRCWTRFLEGCPANRAVLAPRRPAESPAMALFVAIVSYVKSRPGPGDQASTGTL